MSDTIEKIKRLPKLPRHVAIIMDGNGRFANQHGRPRVWGHKKGAERVREMIEISAASGIEVLTLYAFSEENWNRPKFEVKTIMKLIESYLNSELRMLVDNNIRFRMTGNSTRLPSSTKQVIEMTEKKTKHCQGMVLNICLSYGSRSEIVAASRRLAEKVTAGEILPSEIDEQLFSSVMLTQDLCDPDLLIRTSGEKRISNFLLWQIAYSELYFVGCMWPEFSGEEYLKALDSYVSRDRRFGRVKYKDSDYYSNEYKNENSSFRNEDTQC